MNDARPPTLPPNSSSCILLLTSGQLLKIKGIKLYPVEQVAEILRLRELGLAKMGGVSTGIGFLGSPAWAIGAGAALGLLKGALSSQARKEGASLLQQASRLSSQISRSGTLFQFGSIVNNDRPLPSEWFAEMQTTQQVYYNSLTRADKAAVLSRYGKDKSHARDGYLELPDTKRFIHDGGEFICADTETGAINIRWQHVVGYSTT